MLISFVMHVDSVELHECEIRIRSFKIIKQI
jgi:hypothetical protein